MADDHADGGRPLTPFIHQVGGHRGILVYDSYTICKPVCKRELQNYKDMTPVLGEFIPKFRGAVEVVIEKDKDGHVKYTAITAPLQKPSCAEVLHQEKSKDIELNFISSLDSLDSKCSVNGVCDQACGCMECQRRSSDCLDNHSQETNKNNSACPRAHSHPNLLRLYDVHVSDKVFEDTTDFSFRPKGKGLNPWSLRCHLSEVQRLNGDINQPFKVHAEYMLLENIAGNYQCPSIMDLKIGTRCHGDDLSEEKKQLNIARATESTTSKLGVRFGGMQVYQADKGTYICCNKKYGNTLTEEHLRREVGRFVYDRHSCCQLIRKSILERIGKLKALISRLEGYRFFGCSVLIMYEGADDAIHGEVVSPSENRCGIVDSAPALGQTDSGALRNSQGEKQHDGFDEDSGTGDSPEVVRDDDDDCHSNDGNITVRIIDYAHASSVELQGADGVSYKGMDKGFVYGLENLLDLL